MYATEERAITYKGQLEGKVGWNSVALAEEQPGPLSPEAYKIVVPRAPS